MDRIIQYITNFPFFKQSMSKKGISFCLTVHYPLLPHNLKGH